MKSAIVTSFNKEGILCDEGKGTVDVGIVVSGLLRPEGNQPDFIYKSLQGIKAKRWVILSSQKNDPVYQYLAGQGCDPCVIPEEIDSQDLCHVAKLASSGHVISMGKFCQNAHPEDARLLAKADLSDDQWRLLAHLSLGMTNKEIAIEEDTTEAAVKARLRCLLRKIGLNNRTKAAVLAARCGVSLKSKKS